MPSQRRTGRSDEHVGEGGGDVEAGLAEMPAPISVPLLLPALQVLDMLGRPMPAPARRSAPASPPCPASHVATSFSYMLVGFAVRRWLGIIQVDKRASTWQEKIDKAKGGYLCRVNIIRRESVAKFWNPNQVKRQECRFAHAEMSMSTSRSIEKIDEILCSIYSAMLTT